MTKMASQITSLTVVYSTVYSDADQIKHQSSVPRAFVWGIHRDRWIPRTKGQLRGKCFHLMTSSCISRRRRAYHVLLETPSFQRCHLCQTNDSQGHRFSRLLPREPSSLCRYFQRVDQIQPKYGGKMCSKVQNYSKVLYEMRLSGVI